MIYYRTEARKSALDELQRLRGVIMSTSCDELSFSDGMAICRYLSILTEEIEKEMKREG